MEVVTALVQPLTVTHKGTRVGSADLSKSSPHPTRQPRNHRTGRVGVTPQVGCRVGLRRQGCCPKVHTSPQAAFQDDSGEIIRRLLQEGLQLENSAYVDGGGPRSVDQPAEGRSKTGPKLHSQRGSPASSLSPTWWFSTFGQPHTLCCGSREMADVNVLGECQGYQNVRRTTLSSAP